MTAEQAKQALKEGNKVRCLKWHDHEYLFGKDKSIMFNNEEDWENVDEYIFEDYKDDEWEIVE